MGWAVWGVLAVASATSMVLGRPWTMVPARRRQPRELWTTPLFREANQVVSAAWTGFFIVAAAICAISPWWASVVLAVLSVFLAVASDRIGTTYVARKLARAARFGSAVKSDSHRVQI